MAELKRCCRCEEDKPRDRFSPRKSVPDGLEYICKDCQSIRRKNYYWEDVERARAQRRKFYLNYHYKDTPEGTGRFHVDHDHLHCAGNKESCGKCIRGLLCTNCNTGNLRDDPELLRAKADYIEKFRIGHPELFT